MRRCKLGQKFEWKRGKYRRVPSVCFMVMNPQEFKKWAKNKLLFNIDWNGTLTPVRPEKIYDDAIALPKVVRKKLGTVRYGYPGYREGQKQYWEYDYYKIKVRALIGGKSSWYAHKEGAKRTTTYYITPVKASRWR